jgi:HAD superfamily hydrolase (TIGR01509 family)
MIEAALLDVDGTLIDDNLLHVLAWSRAFRRLGRSFDTDTLLHAIGMGGDKLVPALLGEVGEREAAEARRLHAEEYVQKGLITRAEPLPGARALLAALRARGVRLALASSANQEELDRYLGMLGGPDAVDAQVVKQDVAETKPAPHLFTVALERLGGPTRALVIGDTVYDVQAAREAGLPCVGVLSGGIERGVLAEAGAAAIYEGPQAVLDDLDRVLALG